MSHISGIQGQLLEVTVVGCNKLKDTEWISRQDPYVIVEYGSNKSRTRTCTDGGKNPTFQEKFVFTLIEGLRELNLVVWNSNTLTYDDFIGSGKVQLQKVLSEGYDDSTWTLQTKTGRYAGEVRLILHYANASKPAGSFAPSAPPYAAPAPSYAAPAPHVSMYSTPPPASTGHYPQLATAYAPPSPYPSYPPNPAYPPSAYPSSTAYPPHPYPAPSAYPPPPYPPPPNASPYYPPGPFPGVYPPPPY
ncbi:protein binding protein, putative [Ricinus communis]|uniref:Protein binding protein, putative n=2 Tax=Ricinus communis TaxID=3988 RepID=B9RYB9_RICCO|nr:protein binding protein, putative [Ricinus communis]